MIPVLLFPQFDPVLVQVGPLAIRWYALAYIGSLLLGWRIMRRLVQRTPVVATPEQTDDFLTWATLGVVLGGRLGYVLFYQPSRFLAEPLSIFAVWEGGMSFHGGALGVVVALVVFCHRQRIPLLGFADRIAVVTPIGLGLGRIANFINGELWGRPAPAWLPWAMIFPNGGPVPRHPSQLYQALMEGLVLFLLLWLLARWETVRARFGMLTGVFLVGYAVARSTGELFRQPDAFLGYLYEGATMGQLLSLPMLVAGIGLIALAARRGAGARVMERLDAFMARANTLYYTRHDPFADFTTAPEITQAFGEVLGAWSAVTWEAMGRPDPITLAEAGPGRGTLMADALRAIGRVAPAFRAALRLHLVETSPRLRGIQAAALPDPCWHDAVEALPPGPMILLANEFLDALPIRQFVRRGTAWCERHVQDGAFVDSPCAEPLPDHPDGTIVERRDPALARHIGERLRAAPGAALFLDYGPLASGPGESLQALRAGQPADPLADPGNADLTAHVDFAAFAREAGVPAHGPLQQGKFLTRLGLFGRIDRLARGLPPRLALRMIEAGRRLAEPDRMGALFKALALTSPGLPVPAGFEA